MRTKFVGCPTCGGRIRLKRPTKLYKDEDWIMCHKCKEWTQLKDSNIIG